MLLSSEVSKVSGIRVARGAYEVKTEAGPSANFRVRSLGFRVSYLGYRILGDGIWKFGRFRRYS